ncbi:MAG: uracil-DNA glycosylase family protein [Candidatus Micrarchaeia archaeon]
MKFVYSAGFFVYAYDKGTRKFFFLIREEGSLDFPKGMIEKGESAEAAAEREAFEEAGIRLKKIPYFKTSYAFIKTENKELVKKHVTMFLSRIDFDTKITISFEHKGYTWLSFEEAKKKIYKDEVEAFSAANDYIDRLEAMENLNARYSSIYLNRKDWMLSKKFVAGEGPLNAKFMFVGQAPGRKEDEQGRPFVGASGMLLDSLLRIARIEREKVYITSVVQFFPPKNRPLTVAEIEECMPFLKQQIRIIKPKLIVLLGAVATKALLGPKEKITELHGKVIEKGGISYFITLHPAYAVRLKKNEEVIKNDFRTLRELKKLFE